MSLGLALKIVQPRARCFERASQVGKGRAMARNHADWVKFGNQVQGGAHGVKRVFAFKLWKHDAKAVFPQGVGRNQQPRLWRKQHHRMRVVPGCGVYLPFQPAQVQRAAG